MSANPLVWLSRHWLACLLLAPGLALAAPFAYITNGLSSSVSVIDTASNTVVATIPVGLGPLGVAVNPTGTRVYVANFASDSVSIIDTATNAVTATVSVGSSPGGVAVNSAGTRVYVTNVDSKNVSVIDTATNTVVATVTVGTSPGGVAVNPTGSRIYVGNGDSNNISVIDAATNAVVATTVATASSPQAIAVDPAGARLYVTMNTPDGVAIIDTGTNAVVGSVGVGSTPAGIAINSVATRVYAANSDSNNVSVIDTATNTVVATVAVGTSPSGIAVNPAGTRVYVANSDSNNVSVIDTATNTVVATVAVGVSPIAFGQFIGPGVATPPNGPELNQHGLTGSWYEPATDGQGIEVEVFPDLVGPGTGSTQVSWFTFDTVTGGADRQRWYTLSGNVVSGQSSAALTIYQNTGGNFNAPPITNGVAVGTATLSFDTCASGQLSYHFNDGRAGNIPLTRITQNVTCSMTSARPTNADFALSGNWYSALTSGQGFTAEVNPINGSVFVPWYTYAPAGAGAGAAGQRWYTASGAFAPGARSIAVDLYETTGGVFDTHTVPAPMSVKVGTGTLAFQSCSNATLNFTFTGGSSSGSAGTIALTRIGPVPTGCKY